MANRLIRVLHVDNDEAEFILLRALLATAQDLDFEFKWVADIKTATQAIYNTNFDVCLVDYTLDVENGLDFVRMSVSNGITIPFILMSGQQDFEIHDEAMKVGVYQCLNKEGATTSALLKIIQDAINQ